MGSEKSGNSGISGIRALFPEEHFPFLEENGNPRFNIFNREVGNAMFCAMGTLGIAIIPGKHMFAYGPRGNAEIMMPVLVS